MGYSSELISWSAARRYCTLSVATVPESSVGEPSLATGTLLGSVWRRKCCQAAFSEGPSPSSGLSRMALAPLAIQRPKSQNVLQDTA